MPCENDPAETTGVGADQSRLSDNGVMRQGTVDTEVDYESSRRRVMLLIADRLQHGLQLIMRV